MLALMRRYARLGAMALAALIAVGGVAAPVGALAEGAVGGVAAPVGTLTVGGVAAPVGALSASVADDAFIVEAEVPVGEAEVPVGENAPVVLPEGWIFAPVEPDAQTAPDGSTGSTDSDAGGESAPAPPAAWLVAEEITLPPDAVIPPPPSSESAFTLLLIGYDSYSDKGRGRSDAMILAQLDAETGAVKLISFMRDLYVQIPGRKRSRLNAAYASGGGELLLKTLETNFGVTANGYVAVNFARMAKLIDAIGGVTVTVEKRELYYLNSILQYYNKQIGARANDELLAAHGTQTLTGKQALSYSRIRHMDSDYQRTARQRRVLGAVFRKLTSLDAAQLTALALANFGSVTTNLTLADAARLIPMALSVRDAEIYELRVPVAGGYSPETIGGASVIVPSLTRNKREINAFLWGEAEQEE